MSRSPVPYALFVCTLALAACGSEVAGGVDDALLLDVVSDGSGELDADVSGPDEDAAVDAGDDVAVSDASGDAADSAMGDADAEEDLELITIDDAVEDVEDEDAAAPDAAPDASPADTGELRWRSAAPTADGPYGAQRFEETIATPVQDVRTLIFLPEDGSDAPYPVVVFNHGFQLAAENFQGYARRLASHGFVVLLPNIGDSLFRARTHTELRDIQVAIDDWIVAAEGRPGSRIYRLVDTSLLGVGGHSRGGKQAMFAAVSDDRIAAYFGVDPVDSGPPFGSNPTDYPSVTPELMSGLTVPSGFIGSGLGAQTAFPGAPQCAPTADNYTAYYAEAPSPSFAWRLPEAGHNDFVEDCNFTCQFACPMGDATAAEFARTTMLAFFKVFLAGDDSYRAWLDGDALRADAELSSR